MHPDNDTVEPIGTESLFRSLRDLGEGKGWQYSTLKSFYISRNARPLSSEFGDYPVGFGGPYSSDLQIQLVWIGPDRKERIEATGLPEAEPSGYLEVRLSDCNISQVDHDRIVVTAVAKINVTPIPVPSTTPLDPTVVVAPAVKLTILTEATVTYEVQSLPFGSEEWTLVQTVKGDGEMATLCVDRTTSGTLFRVAVVAE